MVGLGDPRTVRAGVVGGSYFEVMGLRPVLGRLLNAGDDGPKAEGAAVLTHRFWTTAFRSDPSVIGRAIRLSDRPATIVGVLEPSVPYPQETEIIANVVTSPHHLDATMVDGRVHRMTELFGRLAPSADLETARAELRAAHGAILKEHPEAYQAQADFRIEAVKLRDQIISPARTILLVLLAASALVFIVACSNVANLILARSVRREGELAIRAALGAGTAALRRTLLAESLLLCGVGAVLAIVIARPMVSVLARYAARYSVRANDVTVDATLLWVGVVLAVAAAVLLAFVPRLPSADSAQGLGLSSGSVRITTGTNRRLKMFAITQIAASFLLLAGAGMLVTALLDAAAPADRLPRQRARGERAGGVVYPQAGSGGRLLQGSDSPHLGAAGRRAGGARHCRPVARPRLLRGAVHRRGLPQGERRRGSARAVPHRLAGILFRAGAAPDRRTRLQRRRSARRRARRDRQPEPRAADVPQHGRGQPPADVDRSGHQVHRRQQRPPPHRRRGSRHRRREHRAGADDDDLSPDGAGDERRAAVRARQDGSVHAGAADHTDHPRPRRRISRSSGRRRSTTSAPKCCRRPASTRWCSAASPAWRWPSPWSASPACWRSRSARGRASSACAWPSARRRRPCSAASSRRAR